MGMTTSPGGSSAGGKSMGGPNTSAPGGGGNDYNGNPNYGGMPTQYTGAAPGGMSPGLGNMYGGNQGPGMGVGMDYRNLGSNPNQGGGMQQPSPGLPSNGMGGGKGIGGIINQVPGIIGGGLFGPGSPLANKPLQDFTSNVIPKIGMPGMGGGQLVGGAYGKPIIGMPGGPQFNPGGGNQLIGADMGMGPGVGFGYNPPPEEMPNDDWAAFGDPNIRLSTPERAGGQLVGGPAGKPITNARGDFFDSPEYQKLNTSGPQIDTMDIYNSPYFGQGGGSATGAPRDRAYEAYLQRTGQKAGYGINKDYNMFGDLFGQSPGNAPGYTPAQQQNLFNNTLGKQPVTNQPGGPRNNRFAPPNAPGVRTAPAAAVSRTNVQSPARVAKPITRTRAPRTR